MGQEVSQKNIVEASNTENATYRKIPVLGSFLIRLLANSLQLFWMRDSNTGAIFEFMQNFSEVSQATRFFTWDPHGISKTFQFGAEKDFIWCLLRRGSFI